VFCEIRFEFVSLSQVQDDRFLHGIKCRTEISLNIFEKSFHCWSGNRFMRIREAGIEDVEGIADLFGQLGYAGQGERIAQQLRTLTDSASGRVFVAESGAALAALAGVAVVHLMLPLHVEAGWALLSALVVDQAHRGAGVGAQLLAAAERFAREKGCTQLELSSSATRTRAHRFYEQNGYREKRLRFLKTFQ
jgi:GNAT superfamily N-acetyltransferase